MVGTDSNPSASAATALVVAQAPTDDDHDDGDIVQGRTTGLIIPPPVIKSVLEKTAEWVAKKGNIFLEQIRIKRGDNPQFGFVFPSSPYHAYFLHRTDELALEIHNKQNGIVPPKPLQPTAKLPINQSDASVTKSVTTTVTAVQPAAAAASTEAAVSSSVSRAPVVSALAEALKVQIKNKSPPPPYQFSLPRNPVDVSSKSAELMRLTAQFTAIKGKSFLTQLARREMGNPDFYFLNALSPHFAQVFSPLLNAYKKVIHNEQKNENKKKMQALVEDHSVLLNRAVHRVTWTRAKEEEKRAKEREERADKQAFLEIDWQDFVVVETIKFEDPAAPAPLETPGPLTAEGEGLAAVAAAAVAATEAANAAAAAASENTDQAAAVMVTEEVDDDSEDGMDMDDSDMDDESEEVVIRTDHVPRVVQESQAPGGDMVTLHGRQVPVDQANEQLRIELIDPKWKQQQKVFQERQKTTPFEAERDIAKNIKRMAANRPDVFSNRSTEEQANNSFSTASATGEGWAQNKQTASAEADKQAAALDRQEVKDMVSRAKAAKRAAASGTPPHAPVSAGMPPTNKRPLSAVTPTPPPPAPVARAYVPPVIPTPPLAPKPHQPVIPSMPFMPPSRPAPIPQAPPMPMGIPPEEAIVAPPPPPPVPASASVEPDAKRAKLDGVASDGVGLRVAVSVPLDKESTDEWKLNGQTVSLNVKDASSVTVKELKEMLLEVIGPVPLSRFQLKAPSGFLKDKKTLEAHKLTDGVMLEMKLKTRGR